MSVSTIESLTLRRAQGADIPALEALYRRSFAPALRGVLQPSELVAALQVLTKAQKRLVETAHYYLALDEQGQLLGVGGWSFASPSGVPTPSHMAHIRHFAVDPAAAGRGVGSLLLRRSVAEAKEAGARILDCEATPNAAGFFAAHGFRELGPVTVPVKPGLSYPALRLQQRL